MSELLLKYDNMYIIWESLKKKKKQFAIVNYGNIRNYWKHNIWCAGAIISLFDVSIIAWFSLMITVI